MCLIAFAWKVHPRYRLILAANRDEFFERPTQALHWWEDSPNLLAGKDLKAGGTWMGVSKGGRFSALTNFRDLSNLKADAPTRGKLVSDYLEQEQSPEDYLASIAPDRLKYNGFNLLTGIGDELWYLSHDTAAPLELSPGIYGLSNHFLDTPWPKVQKAKQGMASIAKSEELKVESLIALLGDPTRAADEQLPDTGVGLEWERMLSPMFIRSEKYGTRATSALLIAEDGGIEFVERSFVPEHSGSFRFHPNS